MTTRASVRIGLIGALSALIACSGGSGDSIGPTLDPVASVEVQSPISPLLVAEKVQLAASTRNAAGSELTGRTVTWSSSSTAIATVSSTGEVEGRAAGTAQITAKSEGKQNVVTITVRTMQVSLSPDTYLGGAIAYSSFRSGNQIDAFVVDQTGLHRITSTNADERVTEWSPDGSRLSIFRVAGGSPSSFTITAAGGDDQPIFDGRVYWNRDWSKYAGVVQSQLTIANANGSASIVVNGVPGLINGVWWSPDGTKLAFASSASGSRFDIYLVNSDGTGLRNLTNSADIGESFADWNSAGTKLLLDGIGADGKSFAYMAELGGSIAILSTGGTASEPRWSPDGAKILFTSRRDGNPASYIVNANGGFASRLSPPDIGATEAQWSPDGTRIAFSGTRGTSSSSDIFVMTVDRSSLLQLTDTPATDFSPVWKR